MDRRRSPLVLVTDDDSSLRSLLVIALTAAGYTLAEAVNGQECLLKVERLQPDLVLLDALMPEMDGFTCCQKLRSRPQTQNLPILMITFLDDRDSIEQAFQAGATDYIPKPIHWEVLRQRVQSLLKAAQLTQQATFHEHWNSCFSQLLTHLTQSAALTPSLAPILTPLLEGLGAQRLLIYGSDYSPLLEACQPHVGPAMGHALGHWVPLHLLEVKPELCILETSTLLPAGAEILARWNTTALLLCPMVFHHQRRGWLCLHTDSDPSSWDENLKARCQDLAHVFALFLGQ